MENGISESVDWIGMLLNWVFFFGLVTVIIFPAMKFQNLAKRHGQKGWLFFIAGFGVGLLGLTLGRMFMSWVSTWVVPGYHSYLLASLFFIPPIIIYLIFYRVLKKNIAK